MASKKRKTLPADFAQQLATKPLAELQAIFDTTELTATGGVSKKCALAYPECPDDFVRWIVAAGLPIDTRNAEGWTPLNEIAGAPAANVALYLDLGADPDGGRRGVGGPHPLISAVTKHNLDHIKLLLDRGADPLAFTPAGQPERHALLIAVERCDRRNAADFLPIVEYLAALTRPGGGLKKLFGKPEPLYPVSDAIKQKVAAHGQTLENVRFERGGTLTEPADLAFEAAVRRLYTLFAVTPVAPIPVVAYDGASPIVVTAADWQGRYQQLWAMLVPPRGAAATVQGELVRVAGRLRDEIARNGGANWDRDFEAMGQAFLGHLQTGRPVAPATLAAAQQVVAAISGGRGWDSDFGALDRAAVEWTGLNPNPVALPAPPYKR
jgi:hypothetical protein